jgi:Fur family transcriptional regulator, zinc uptake regulator
MQQVERQAPEAHDHARCVARAVLAAQRICAVKQLALTPIRTRVLQIVWRSHEPVGAYEILAELSKDRQRSGPPTVYRALEFLVQAGLVHRLDALNAFVGCRHPEVAHAPHFLICHQCKRVAEISDGGVTRALRKQAQSLGFPLEDSSIEIKSLCTRCAAAPPTKSTQR